MAPTRGPSACSTQFGGGKMSESPPHKASSSKCHMRTDFKKLDLKDPSNTLTRWFRNITACLAVQSSAESLASPFRGPAQIQHDSNDQPAAFADHASSKRDEPGTQPNSSAHFDWGGHGVGSSSRVVDGSRTQVTETDVARGLYDVFYDRATPDFGSLNWEGASIDYGAIFDSVYITTDAGMTASTIDSPWTSVAQNYDDIIWKAARHIWRNLILKGKSEKDALEEMKTCFVRLQALIKASSAKTTDLKWTFETFAEAAQDKLVLITGTPDAFYTHHDDLRGLKGRQLMEFSNESDRHLLLDKYNFQNKKYENFTMNEWKTFVEFDRIFEIIFTKEAEDKWASDGVRNNEDIIKDVLGGNRANALLEFGRRMYHQNYLDTFDYLKAAKIAKHHRGMLLSIFGAEYDDARMLQARQWDTNLPENEFVQAMWWMTGLADFIIAQDALNGLAISDQDRLQDQEHVEGGHNEDYRPPTNENDYSYKWLNMHKGPFPGRKDPVTGRVGSDGVRRHPFSIDPLAVYGGLSPPPWNEPVNPPKNWNASTEVPKPSPAFRLHFFPEDQEYLKPPGGKSEPFDSSLILRMPFNHSRIPIYGAPVESPPKVKGLGSVHNFKRTNLAIGDATVNWMGSKFLLPTEQGGKNVSKTATKGDEIIQYMPPAALHSFAGIVTGLGGSLLVLGSAFGLDLTLKIEYGLREDAYPEYEDKSGQNMTANNPRPNDKPKPHVNDDGHPNESGPWSDENAPGGENHPMYDNDPKQRPRPDVDHGYHDEPTSFGNDNQPNAFSNEEKLALDKALETFAKDGPGPLVEQLADKPGYDKYSTMIYNYAIHMALGYEDPGNILNVTNVRDHHIAAKARGLARVISRSNITLKAMTNKWANAQSLKFLQKQEGEELSKAADKFADFVSGRDTSMFPTYRLIAHHAVLREIDIAAHGISAAKFRGIEQVIVTMAGFLGWRNVANLWDIVDPDLTKAYDQFNKELLWFSENDQNASKQITQQIDEMRVMASKPNAGSVAKAIAGLDSNVARPGDKPTFILSPSGTGPGPLGANVTYGNATVTSSVSNVKRARRVRANWQSSWVSLRP
ncbi:hypothetical protein BJ166DRAFT_537632 [Pestalotiopsis sp. NC0098]|nr:hypothetical protein BJ166DRAFT_537632 [Pestalotiopsis sp. NC0098]